MSVFDHNAVYPFDYKDEGERYVSEGLTKREWFAGLAMNALVHFGSNLTDKDCSADAPLAKIIASQAYAIADAMLQERYEYE